MVAVKALQSFCTYVGANCVTAHEGSTLYVPQQKADELVAGGLAVLLQDAPPAPPQTKVSPYVVDAGDPAKTHNVATEAADAADDEPEGDAGDGADETQSDEPPAKEPVKPAARRPRQRK